MMDPEIKKQFEDFDERMKEAEKRLLTVGNLVNAGIPMFGQVKSIMDPELRRQLEEAYPEWIPAVEHLFEVWERGNESSQRFLEAKAKAEATWLNIDRTSNGHAS